MSYNSTQSAILVHNLANGFDLYDLKEDALVFVRQYKNSCEQGANIRLPTMFLHGGTSVTGGSTCGGIRIWKRVDETRFLPLKLKGSGEPIYDVF